MWKAREDDTNAMTAERSIKNPGSLRTNWTIAVQRKLPTLRPSRSLREAESGHQFSESSLKPARDGAGNAVANFSTIDGRDRNDFGARAEQENFLKLE